MLNDAFVLLLTYPDATSVKIAQRLADFLPESAKTVTCYAVEIDFPNVTNSWGSALVALPELVAQVEAMNRARAAELLAAVSHVPQNVAVERKTIRARFGQVGSDIVPHAMQHDLTMLIIDPGNPEQRAIAEDIIFGTGRPALVVPETYSEVPDLTNLAVAWDGSRAASRALFDAMPLLQQAKKVTLLTAPTDKPIRKSSVEEVSRYLDRHDVDATHRNLEMDGKDIAQVLQGGAAEEGAGMLVMGAYGHNRVREFLLGGASRGVLQEPRMPLFLSH